LRLGKWWLLIAAMPSLAHIGVQAAAGRILSYVVMHHVAGKGAAWDCQQWMLWLCFLVRSVPPPALAIIFFPARSYADRLVACCRRTRASRPASRKSFTTCVRLCFLGPRKIASVSRLRRPGGRATTAPDSLHQRLDGPWRVIYQAVTRRKPPLNVGDTGIKSEAWSRSGSASYLTTQQTCFL
jgi:hypothetical protein